MGCGASRTDVLKSVVSEANSNSKGHRSKSKNNLESNGEGLNGNNNSSGTPLDSLNSEGSTIPASEKYQNLNGVHNDNLKPLQLPPLKPPRTFNKVGTMDPGDGSDQLGKVGPIAFEVPAADDEAGSLIKKHPPRRLRKIIEPGQSPPEPTLTHDVLQEKAQLANERRNHVLTQRVASARQKSARISSRPRRVIPESEILQEFANGGIESGVKEENEINSPEFM